MTSSWAASPRSASRRSTSGAARSSRPAGPSRYRHDDRPPVRIVPAGAALRRPGVMSGAYDVVVAAGVEVMSRVAMAHRSQGLRLAFGPSVAARYERSATEEQGIGAEMIAISGTSRAMTSTPLRESHRRAARRPRRSLRTRDRPIYVRDEGDSHDELMTTDEGIRRTRRSRRSPTEARSKRTAK